MVWKRSVESKENTPSQSSWLHSNSNLMMKMKSWDLVQDDLKKRKKRRRRTEEEEEESEEVDEGLWIG